jgi:hypothetical protein
MIPATWVPWPFLSKAPISRGPAFCGATPGFVQSHCASTFL